MRMFVTFLVVTALLCPVVAAAEGLNEAKIVQTRGLQSSEELCLMCRICDIGGELCDSGALVEFGCTLCDFVGKDEEEEEPGADDALCLMCEICDINISGELCNSSSIANFSCAACSFLTPDGNDGDGGVNGDGGNENAAIGVCFSEVATVQVLGKGSVPMKDLKIGDSVLTANHEYQPVYAFAHINPEKDAEFIKIYSEGSQNPLEISGAHMVFVEGETAPLRADSIKVGDILMGESPRAVTKIGKVSRKGVYAPLTMGGSVVVDGIVASNYISFKKGSEGSLISHHNLVHIGMSPYRVACLGIFPGLCGELFNNADGKPYYVEFGLTLYGWAFEQASAVQIVVFSGILGVAGFFFVLERIFGASTVPVAVFAILGMLAASKKARQFRVFNGKAKKSI